MKTRALVATSCALLVAIAALSVIAVAADVGQSAAQETTCPADTTFSEDGTLCLSDAVDDNVTTTTSCLQGVLSDDGQFCVVPRLDAPAPAAPGIAGANAPTPVFTG